MLIPFYVSFHNLDTLTDITMGNLQSQKIWNSVFNVFLQKSILNGFSLNQDCKRSYNSGLFISKSLSQVVIATLWQIKLLGHNYLVYFLITKKASFKIQHTTIYTKQRIQTSTCNPTGFGREQDWLDLILHLECRSTCSSVASSWKYSPHQAKGFIGASTCYSELTRGIQCHWMQRPSLQAVTLIPVFQNTP